MSFAPFVNNKDYSVVKTFKAAQVVFLCANISWKTALLLIRVDKLF